MLEQHGVPGGATAINALAQQLTAQGGSGIVNDLLTKLPSAGGSFVQQSSTVSAGSMMPGQTGQGVPLAMNWQS